MWTGGMIWVLGQRSPLDNIDSWIDLIWLLVIVGFAILGPVAKKLIEVFGGSRQESGTAVELDDGDEEEQRQPTRPSPAMPPVARPMPPAAIPKARPVPPKPAPLAEALSPVQETDRDAHPVPRPSPPSAPVAPPRPVEPAAPQTTTPRREGASRRVIRSEQYPQAASDAGQTGETRADVQRRRRVKTKKQAQHSRPPREISHIDEGDRLEHIQSKLEGTLASGKTPIQEPDSSFDLGSIRRAVLLREILGPPIALREGGHFSNL